MFILLVAAVQLLLIRFGGSAFRCTPLSARELLAVLALSFTVIPADLLRRCAAKALREKRKKDRGRAASNALSPAGRRG